MISLQKAWEEIKGIKMLTEPEALPIGEVVQRYSAEDVIANHDSPPFTQSRYDGYALGEPGDDLFIYKITSTYPITAGDGAYYSLSKGEAIPIMTGAPVPKGTQKIVPNEICQVNQSFLKIESESFYHNDWMVLEKGADFKKGEIYLKRYEKITPIHIAFMALDGLENIKVFSRPSIALICSGDELEVHTEKILKNGKIRNSHPELIKASLLPYGKLQKKIRLPDDLNVMKEALSEMIRSDSHILITTGGMGQGVKDLTRSALRGVGATPLFEGIEAIPIGTFSCYRYNKKVIFSLPGGMVGVILLVRLYILPFVKMMQGWFPSSTPGPFIKAKIDKRSMLVLSKKKPRKGIRFIKGHLWSENGVEKVTPLDPSYHSLKKLNAFIILDSESHLEKSHDRISVFKLWNNE